MIENTPEVVDILRARYPAALIQVQDFDGTPNLTPADQVTAGQPQLGEACCCT